MESSCWPPNSRPGAGSGGSDGQIGWNMGLYNVIFAFGLIGTMYLGRLDAFRAQSVLLSLIIVAGLVGTLTIGSPKIAIVQSLPAALRWWPLS